MEVVEEYNAYEDFELSSNSLLDTFDDDLKIGMNNIVDNDPWIGNGICDSFTLFNSNSIFGNDDIATG